MGFFNEVQVHRYRCWKTICTSLLFTALGLHSAVFGPSLIDLAAQLNTTIDQITHILPARAFGNMIGSTACGFALSYFDHQIVLMFSMLTMSLSIFFIPLSFKLWQLYSCMLVNGISGGFLVNAGNCFVIHKWGKENSPFMQMAHFSFGIGAFISPFIVEPFLSETKDDEDEIISNSTYPDVAKTPLNGSPDSGLKTAYFIIGAVSMFIWLMFIITYLKKKDNKPHPTREIKIKEAKNNESTVKIEIVKLDRIYDVELDKKPNGEIKKSELDKQVFNVEKKLLKHHKWVIVILSALFIHLAYGLELSFGVMLASYANLSNLHLSKSSASFITSVYWGCFTFFRLCTLVLINFVSSRTMLILDLVLIMIANVFLLPFANNYAWALWVGSCFMGIGVSSIYPTLWSFLEQILPVTSKMTSVVNSCACIGEFIVPVLIGAYIKTWPEVYLYIIFLYSSLACVIFGGMVFWEFLIYRYKRSP